MIGVDLNPVVKEYLVGQGYTDIDISALFGYDDSTVPFITWEESVSTRNIEQYWLRESVLTYYIFDTDLSRAKDIAKKVDFYLNLGDLVDDLKIDMNSSDYRICWSRMIAGDMFPSLERDGFNSIVRSFEIGYIQD